MFAYLMVLKETDCVKSFNIVENKTLDEINKASEKWNSNEKYDSYSVVIKDKHIIQALSLHDTGDLSDYFDDIATNINRAARALEDAEEEIRELKEIINK